MTQVSTVFAAAFFGSILATGLVRLVSHRIGFLYRPVSYRWNQRTVALGGGVGIVLSFLLSLWFISPDLFRVLSPPILALFLMGLFDDVRILSPITKLIVQLAVAIWAVSHGFVLQNVSPWIAYPLTVFWIVGMTNGFNIIDNIDGLAGGVAAIAGFFFFVLLGVMPGGGQLMWVALALSGASLGFFFHNFSPARVFMGDAGSLPLGFILSVLATVSVQPTEPFGSILTAFVPVCFILLVPLFDVLLVCISRKMIGRSVSCGGRDHTSHRLVGLGLSDAQTVRVLHYFCLIGGLLALGGLAHGDLFKTVSCAGALVLIFAALAYLLSIPVYNADQVRRPNLLGQLLIFVFWSGEIGEGRAFGGSNDLVSGAEETTPETG